MNESLPRAARIRRGAEIREILRRGRRRGTRLIDVRCRPGAGPLPRAGWIVPKLGHRIVDRNRLKRRVREIARRQVLRGLTERGLAVDVLVRVRRPAYRASYQELAADIVSAVEGACTERR